MAPKILIVLTSADVIPKTGKKIGWYLPELAHPWDVLHSRAELIFASPKGGNAPLDPNSVEMFAKDESSVNFLNGQKDLWQNTKPLSEFAGKASEFDAIFFPGGHGPMFDLAFDKTSQDLIADFYAQGKVVSAVCHGPAALAYVNDKNGESILKGRTVTGFSNQEEETAGYTAEMPWLLESRLNEVSGGKFVTAAEPFGEKVVVDGNVITGGNPASAKAVGEAIAKALG